MCWTGLTRFFRNRALPNKLAFLTIFFCSVFSYSNLHSQPAVTNSLYCPTGSGPTTYTTVGTYYTGVYDSPGTGNCGFPTGTYDPNLFAAIDGNTSNDYANGEACGACVAARDAAAGTAVTVMIIDNCATCGTAHQLDFSPAAFTDLAGSTAPGLINITWNFVPCPLSLMTGDSSGDIEYEWKSGCSGFYDPIQFLDMLFPIVNVSYSTSDTGPFTALVLGSSGVGGDEYWGPTSGNLNSNDGSILF